MPLFRFHIRRNGVVCPDDSGIEVADLHHAYLEAIKSIPDIARDMLLEGEDPMSCAFLICDALGRRMMEVPFREIVTRGERP